AEIDAELAAPCLAMRQPGVGVGADAVMHVNGPQADGAGPRAQQSLEGVQENVGVEAAAIGHPPGDGAVRVWKMGEKRLLAEGQTAHRYLAEAKPAPPILSSLAKGADPS